LKRLAPPDAPIVLDVGCSSGYVLREIKRVLPEAALIGSDYILAPLVKLGAQMPDLPILQFDLRQCPLSDNCVDAVTALNVLEHIDEDEKALSEIHRILKPQGIAYIEVPAGPELFDVYDEHLMHHRRYRLTELVTMARRVGFGIEETTHLGFFVYPAFWIVKKQNRRRAMGRGAEEAAAQVATHIRSTGGSALMTALMQVEMALAGAIKFPFGIRCIAVLRKPANH
jgi:SAM-dependent methyltransferase